MLVLNRVCETFSIPPTRALWELENDPDGLALKIIRARAYEQAWGIVKNSKDEATLPSTPLTEMAIEFLFGDMEKEYARRMAEAAERAAKQSREGQDGHG